MTRDPPTIGSAPEDVVIAMIEHPFECFFGVEIISGSGMFDSFGFSRGTASVENKEWCFTIHRFGGAISGRIFDEFMPPEIAPRFHVDVVTHTSKHDTFFDRRRFF